MSDEEASRALQEIKERLAAINFAIDAIQALRDAGKIDDDAANAHVARLHARYSDLRATRRSIILTRTAATVPSAADITTLRRRVNKLYQWNASVAAVSDLIDLALEIAEA